MKKYPHILFFIFLLASLKSFAGTVLTGNPPADAPALAANAPNSIDFSMIGYATVAGEGYATTTGGAGGNAITIHTLEELQSWAAGRENNTTPEIVYISGKISATSSTVVTIKHGENVSVLGLGSTAELENVGLNFRNYKNVIIRNLKIHEVFYPNDGLTIDESQHVWIDHCEFHSIIGDGIGVDTYDGLLDIKKGSRYVTVSWSHFHDHMKTVLIGHTDNSGSAAEDRKMRVTFHHNFFENTDGRNPSLRWGAVHMFNNYLKNISDYGIAVRQGAHALLENNVYENVKLPISTNKFTGDGYACERGNLFTGTSGNNSITQTDCDWWNETTLPYEYTIDEVNTVTTTVPENVGVGKIDVTEDGGGNSPGVTFLLSTAVSGSGTIEPANEIYEEGETATLTASPQEGWEFRGWSGDADGNDNPLTLTMDNNKSVTATFIRTGDGGEPDPEPEGPVTIAATASPAEGLCSFDGSTRVAGEYTVINLSNSAGKGISWKVEVPAAGNYDLKWRYAGGGSSATEAAKLLINGSTAVESVAFPKPANSTSYLTTEVISVPLQKGVNEIRIEVIESAAFADIESIEVAGEDVLAADCSREVGSGGNTSAPATFNISVNSLPSAGGTISFSPEGGSYEEGTEVTITATPASGYTFTEWSDDLSGTTTSTTFEILEDMEITAIFSDIQHALSTTVDGEGTIIGVEELYRDGESVILTAEAAAGWAFVQWEGDAEGSANPLTITINEDIAVTAVFKEIALGVKQGYESNNGEGNLKVYPNPYRRATTFEITLKKRSEIKISLFSGDGQLVQEVIHQTFDAGRHKLGYQNSALTPGIYFYLLETDAGKWRSKLLVE